MCFKDYILLSIFLLLSASCMQGFSKDLEKNNLKLEPAELCGHFYNKTYEFENQVYQMCGQSCDTLLKKRTVLDTFLNSIYFTYLLAKLALVTGVTVGIYSCWANEYLQYPRNLIPWGMSLTGFLAAQFMSNPSALCAFTCQEMREYQVLFKTVFNTTENCISAEV